MELLIALPLSSAHVKMRLRERWSRERVEAYQQARLTELRAYALRHSPFYRAFHSTAAGPRFEDLPVLTKAVAMENFDQLVTDRAVRLADVRRHVQTAQHGERYLGRYRPQFTSGTTGRVGVTLFDRRAWVAQLASWVRAADWAGVPVNPLRRTRQASVASVSPWATSGQITLSFDSIWAPYLRLSAGDPLAEIVAGLNRWRPGMVTTYASMVRTLAVEQLAGRLSIRPRAVFSTGEVQTPEGRRLAREAWGQEPFDQYAATETGAIAAECREGRKRHLMDDLNVIEVVDEDNRRVPPGSWGTKVLVTPLGNHVTPLIRYVLTDRVRLSDEPCRCGRSLRVVADIEGRGEEVLLFPTERGDEIAIDPQVYHPILDRLPVSGWQIRREGDRVVVLLVPAGLTVGSAPDAASGTGIDRAAVAASLDQLLAARGARVAAIDVRLVDAIERTAAGKAPVVQPAADRAGRLADDEDAG